jgi:hypothetical protein
MFDEIGAMIVIDPEAEALGLDSNHQIVQGLKQAA